MKELIVQAVNELHGCKANQLVSEVTEAALREGLGSEWLEELPTWLEELVSEGKITEVEYVLPMMEYRIKSFYLPAKTRVKIARRWIFYRGRHT